MRDTPYLIQRLILVGEKKEMELDWMGAAEFEGRAIPQCIDRMRAEMFAPRWGRTIEKIAASSGQEVWFVGVNMDVPNSRVKLALEFFERELGPEPEIVKIDSPYRLKEKTFIRNVFSDPEGFAKSLGKRIVGWWCLDEGIEFALFLSKEYAEEFVAFLKGHP